MTATEVIEALGLEPHPEGGFFREVYRSDGRVEASALPGRYSGRRALGTAIYYLMTPDGFSEMHRLESDEVYHFYLGDPVEQLRLYPDGRGETIVLGRDLTAGERPLTVAPRGVWQGSRIRPGGEQGYALVGTTVAPGFDFDDYESGMRVALMEAYPEFRKLIGALTRD